MPLAKTTTAELVAPLLDRVRKLEAENHDLQCELVQLARVNDEQADDIFHLQMKVKDRDVLIQTLRSVVLKHVSGER